MMAQLGPWLSRVRRAGRVAALGVGVAAVLVAFVLAAFQGVLPDPIRSPLVQVAEAAGRSTVAWALALLGVGYALWRVIRGRRHASPALDWADDPPEASLLEHPRTGNRFEAIVEDRAERVTDPVVEGDRIRDGLADVLVDVETRGDDRTERDVRSAIASGEWTDDRVVAAFLGGDSAPGYPLRARFRGWIRPTRAFERRVERTVDEIYDRFRARERTTGVEHGGREVDRPSTGGANGHDADGDDAARSTTEVAR